MKSRILVSSDISWALKWPTLRMVSSYLNVNIFWIYFLKQGVLEARVLVSQWNLMENYGIILIVNQLTKEDIKVSGPIDISFSY